MSAGSCAHARVHVPRAPVGARPLEILKRAFPSRIISVGGAVPRAAIIDCPLGEHQVFIEERAFNARPAPVALLAPKPDERLQLPC